MDIREQFSELTENPIQGASQGRHSWQERTPERYAGQQEVWQAVRSTHWYWGPLFRLAR